MKRAMMIIGLGVFLLLGTAAQAQIVLQPTSTGTVMQETNYGVTTASGPSMFVGRDSNSSSYCWPPMSPTSCTTWSYFFEYQGVIEFNIESLLADHTSITSSNFTARLNGVTAADVMGSGTFYVNLHDLNDSSEDG